MGNRKYPKTTGYYVYTHIIPDKLCYFGISRQQPNKRWYPSQYRNISLYQYIEEFGWDNIEHMVIQDGLTKHQAEVIEDWFITNATKDGFCINKNRSGGIERDNKSEYNRSLYQSNSDYRERILQRNRAYNRNRYKNDAEFREHKREYQQRPEFREYKREYKRNRYQNDVDYREHIREYMRNYRLKKKQENEKTDYNTMSKIA